MRYYIFHFTNGFVFIGELDATKNVIHKCFNIRRYGTSKGIGQIAISGGTDQTTLDLHGSLEFNPDYLMFKTPLSPYAKEWFLKHCNSVHVNTESYA